MHTTPLILLHGALGASSQLSRLAERLRASMPVHSLDFEGHGTSPATSRPFRMQSFAENILALLDREGIERANLFGYSMGGYVALTLACSHPHCVERLVTLGTKFHWDPDVAERDARRLDPGVIRAKVPAFAAALEARHDMAGGWEQVLANTAEMLRTIGASPVLTRESLSGVSQRVTLIVGDRDDTVSPTETAEVAGWIPDATSLVLADTPHPIEKVDVEGLAATIERALG